MQLCVIAGPVSCPRKCGGYIEEWQNRKGWTRRKFVFLFPSLFPLSFSRFPDFFSLSFSFFYFILFSPVSFLGRFLGFGLHTGLQQRAVKRRNFCLAGARVVGESVSLESIETSERICRWIFCERAWSFGGNENEYNLKRMYIYIFLNFFLKLFFCVLWIDLEFSWYNCAITKRLTLL